MILEEHRKVRISIRSEEGQFIRGAVAVLPAGTRLERPSKFISAFQILGGLYDGAFVMEEDMPPGDG